MSSFLLRRGLVSCPARRSCGPGSIERAMCSCGECFAFRVEMALLDFHRPSEDGSLGRALFSRGRAAVFPRLRSPRRPCPPAPTTKTCRRGPRSWAIFLCPYGARRREGLRSHPKTSRCAWSFRMGHPHARRTAILAQRPLIPQNARDERGTFRDCRMSGAHFRIARGPGRTARTPASILKPGRPLISICHAGQNLDYCACHCSRPGGG